MNTISRLLWILTSFIGLQLAVTPPAAAQDGDKLRAMYVKFLDEKGWEPEVDKDGDVVFKTDDKTYFIDVHEKDPEFFMIALPNIWPIESATERTQVMKAADHANSTTMAAKVYTKGNNVWVTAETFVADPRDFEGIFGRCFSSLKTSTDQFISKMK